MPETNQYIKLDNEKIKHKAPGFTNTKMIGLYAMVSTYLSNPEFVFCGGGLKNALMKHCSNRKLSFSKVWNLLCSAGYLKRSRIPYDKNKFRDFYELLELPDFEIPAVRNMTSAEGREYLKAKPSFSVPEHNYTGISVEMLMDNRLSLLSKGLYCIIQRLIMIAVNTPELVITKELLSSNLPEGCTSFNNAWRQLKTLGYLELTRVYDDGLRQFRYIYKLNGSPYSQEEKAQKVRITQKPDKRRTSARPLFAESFCEAETVVKQAPAVFAGEETRYYTEEERLSYNAGAEFEIWLPPAYTLNDTEKLREEIKYQIQYDWLLKTKKHPKALIDILVDILTETALINDTGQAIKKYGSVDTPGLKAKFHNLDFAAADYALTSFKASLSEKYIKNKWRYLTSVLLNAKRDLELDELALSI